MKFNLRTPCPQCPFLKSQGYLRPERAREIASVTLKGDKTFTCHKTLHTQHQHCAGALVMSEKAGRPNAMHQIAERLGLYDPSRIDMEAPIYASIEEIAKGHGR